MKTKLDLEDEKLAEIDAKNVFESQIDKKPLDPYNAYETYEAYYIYYETLIKLRQYK